MPPIVIAAGIGAAATIGGAVMSAKAQKSAAKSAAATAASTADKNNALQLDIYGQNKALLSPYSERGNQAGTAINALLGLGSPAQPTSAPQQGYGVPQNALAAPYGASEGRFGNEVMTDTYNGPGMSNMQYGAQQPVNAQPPITAQPGGASPYEAAFGNFLNSTGFRFQMDEGNRAVNTGYAARGTLQSGAAQKALQDRGQQTALGNYFLPYMGLLQGQQGVGMGAASAVAGVGQNYANSVTANNNLAGDAAANAALIRGAATGQMWGGIGNALGTAAGTVFGTSYKKKPI